LKVLVSWLRELVPVQAPVSELAHAFHMAGFEVASVEDVPAEDGGAPDAVIDLEITANRPDCLGMISLAREIAIWFDAPFRDPVVPLSTPADPAVAGDLRVTIENGAACPRYVAALADVTIGPSPAWLARRLAAVGIRSISNIVDITNYVMIETGQALHAFDYAKLAGPELRIRNAREHEKVTTLDGQERKLLPQMLVIADAAVPQALAGVMGGAASEVSSATKTIVLEAAYFAPAPVRFASARLGLETEASYRFRRGADPGAPPRAIARACALIEQIGAGRVRAGWIDAQAAPLPSPTVTLNETSVQRLLGYEVDARNIERIFRGLGFTNETMSAAPGAHVWRFGVPSWRVDVHREADLIEEIARHEKYDRIPTTFPPLTLTPPRPTLRFERDRTARQVLRSAGFSEAVTFTFIERTAATPFVDEALLVSLANPLSEKFAVMRPSLLPGLIDAVAHNRRREQRDVRLFELATRMRRGDGERRVAAWAWSGSAVPTNWSGGARPVDIFDITGAVTTLCGALGLTATFVPAAPAFLHEQSAAAVRVARADDGRDTRDIGIVGQLTPEIVEARGLPGHEPVFVAELDLDAVLDWTSLGDRFVTRPLPRHPSSVRDLSISVAADLPAGAVRDTIRAAAPAFLERIAEFDRYQGKGVAEGRCSLSLRLTFRAADRTLTDAEVQQAVDAIVAALAAAHGATLR